MAKVLLWNSLATRRRSASDTFFDNGLGVLSAHLEDEGHEVVLEDWANDEFYSALAVPFLARPIRRLYEFLLSRKVEGPPPRWIKAVGGVAITLQEIQSFVQNRRMEARIRDLAWTVVEQGIPVVGVKLWYGEAFFWAKYFAKYLQEIGSNALLIAGGYHVSLYEEDVLRFSSFDLAIRGEGEYALGKILSLIDERPERSKSEILSSIAENHYENVMWRESAAIQKGRKRPVRVGRKAIPRYPDAAGKVPIHVIIESLGCPWGKCHFCVHPHFYKKYMTRAVSDVVEEMSQMVDQGIRIFRFAGSDTPPPFGAQIAQGILAAELNVTFGMGSRAVRNCADAEVFERTVQHYDLLLRAGLRAVFIGGETGHDRINKEVMNKGVTRDDLVATSRAIREAERRTGLKVDVSLAFIYPVPLIDNVTQEEVLQANLELLREFQPDSVMATPPGPFKHSVWHKEKERFGFGFDESIIRTAMEYEYVLYKPPAMWPRLDIELQGKTFVELLDECGRFRKAVEAMGIPTDLSDEHFLMARAAGYEGKEGAERFKQETLLDIVSCDYRRLQVISDEIRRGGCAFAS